MIRFPGGEVSVTRTTDNKYWVHINVNRPQDGFFLKGKTVEGEVIDARVDSFNPDKHLKDVGNLKDKDTNHFAVLIQSNGY